MAKMIVGSRFVTVLRISATGAAAIVASLLFPIPSANSQPTEPLRKPRPISQRGDLFQMSDCRVRPGRAGEEIERHVVVVVHRGECNVRVRPSGGIARNHELKQEKARDHPHDDHMLAQRLPNEPWPENESAFSWQTRAALRRMLEPENAALQRLHVLEPHRSREIDQNLDEAVDGYAGRHRATQ